MTPMFEPNPNKLATVGDRVRGCIAMVITITCFTCANYATDNQWLAFFMITAFLNMLVTIGIVFKEN